MTGCNELIFLFHTACIIGATCGALYIGSEALIALVCLESVLSNLMISKQMTLLGMHTVCTDVFAIGSIIGLNLIQEYYGKALAKKTIIINFGILIFYLITSNLHTLYIPNQFDTMHDLFNILFHPMPRIIIISMIVYYVVQEFDTWLFGWLKETMHGYDLSKRMLVCTSTSQLLDTTLFTLGALYGNVASAFHIIVVSYVIKMITILLWVPAVTWIKKFIPERSVPSTSSGRAHLIENESQESARGDSSTELRTKGPSGEEACPEQGRRVEPCERKSQKKHDV